MIDLRSYSTIIFDCDGVILNSNSIKTDAFRSVGLLHSKAASEALVDYHIANGGVSRFAKLDHFDRNIVPLFEAEGSYSFSVDNLLDRFASIVTSELIACSVAQGLFKLREKLDSSKWIVVSGSEQNELRAILKLKNVAELFDGGIFGSPKSKFKILEDLTHSTMIGAPALLIGDSKLDYEVAKKFNLDFIFLTKWSEFASWHSFFETKGVCCLKDIGAMHELLLAHSK